MLGFRRNDVQKVDCYQYEPNKHDEKVISGKKTKVYTKQHDPYMYTIHMHASA